MQDKDTKQHNDRLTLQVSLEALEEAQQYSEERTKSKFLKQTLDVTGKEELIGANEALTLCFKNNFEEDVLENNTIVLLLGNASNLLVDSITQGIIQATKVRKSALVLIVDRDLNDAIIQTINQTPSLLLQQFAQDIHSADDDTIVIDLDQYYPIEAQEILNDSYQFFFSQKISSYVDTIFLTPNKGIDDEFSSLAWGLMEALINRNTPINIIINQALPLDTINSLKFHLDEAYKTNPNTHCSFSVGYRVIPTLKAICLDFLSMNNHLISHDFKSNSEELNAEINQAISKTTF